jgi:hypothetical protein
VRTLIPPRLVSKKEVWNRSKGNGPTMAWDKQGNSPTIFHSLLYVVVSPKLSRNSCGWHCTPGGGLCRVAKSAAALLLLTEGEELMEIPQASME